MVSIMRSVKHQLYFCSKVQLFFFSLTRFSSVDALNPTIFLQKHCSFSHICSNTHLNLMDGHQRSAPFWDFMQHTFQDNVLVPIFKGQADCLTFEDGVSRNFGKKLSCIKSQKSTDLIYTMTSLKSCKQTPLWAQEYLGLATFPVM